jgi:hypothetical protein
VWKKTCREEGRAAARKAGRGEGRVAARKAGRGEERVAARKAGRGEVLISFSCLQSTAKFLTEIEHGKCNMWSVLFADVEVECKCALNLDQCDTKLAITKNSSIHEIIKDIVVGNLFYSAFHSYSNAINILFLYK